MFTTGSYQGAPRVVAMTWGAEDLADSLGASANRDPDGSYGFTYELARSLCLLGAAAAGVAPIETIQGDFRDLDGLRKRAEQVRRDGYRGMLAIHPAQVDVINEAFTPTAEELAAAQEIVDLFAAHPGAGTIGYQGAMLDRPHLARAQALLASRAPHDGRRPATWTSASSCAPATASSSARRAASRRRWSRRCSPRPGASAGCRPLSRPASPVSSPRATDGLVQHGRDRRAAHTGPATGSA